ncbi:amino-acid N-acetyltransferase [Nesterenkonia xinjiangensis]|uniref:Amino-acid N-acetyltransferase n=1 Tax=Nesterenkonia xinjiangensis TaxID=225327 RepID=A0A7Z0GLQ0_9MICC|nr:amino-acid N-acetyltransferase [Nesterenkonia xinjiangensis]NYJ78220.1 amino-acid N-acetyltransferase [Nesterenkonia xinjiangensis]
MSSSDSFCIRPARTADVKRIIELTHPLVERRVLVPKERVSYFESLQEFQIAESDDGDLIGFGALHVMWEDLAEVRTLATRDEWRGHGVGSALLHRLLDDARQLGVSRVFCLTFEEEFFVRHGFSVMENQDAVDPEVYSELLRSQDEGVAEFLDLARVKPNTLGNSRMILQL